MAATTDLATRQGNGAMATQSAGAVMEQVVINGDLAQLSPTQRVAYYQQVCDSLGLNPLTKPFLYIELNGKLTLYATRDATDQLRHLRGVSIKIVSRELVDSVYIVTAQGQTIDGRSDESIGAVPLVKEGGAWKTSQNGKRFFEKDGSLVPLAPEERANAAMKAETKAKRRVTLSVCGLGWLDETEVDSVRGAERVHVQETGEIIVQRASDTAAPAGPTREGPWPRTAAAVVEAPVPVAAPAPKGKPMDQPALLAKYQKLCDDARALGLEPDELADDAPEDTIREYGNRLLERVTARQDSFEQQLATPSPASK